jgi:hypothetical protein
MLLDAPRRLARGGSVPAQVERNETTAGKLRREPLEVEAALPDAVQADDDGSVRIPPLVTVQAQTPSLADVKRAPLTPGSTPETCPGSDP